MNNTALVEFAKAYYTGLARGCRFRRAERQVVLKLLEHYVPIIITSIVEYAASPLGRLAGCDPPVCPANQYREPSTMDLAPSCRFCRHYAAAFDGLSRLHTARRENAMMHAELGYIADQLAALDAPCYSQAKHSALTHFHTMTRDWSIWPEKPAP